MESEPNDKISNGFVQLLEILLLNIGLYLDRLCDLVCPPVLPCLLETKHESGCQSDFPADTDGFYLWNQDFYEMIFKKPWKCYKECWKQPPKKEIRPVSNFFEPGTFASNVYLDEIHFGILLD